MDLKDLPDSELPFMEAAYTWLKTHHLITTDDVVRAQGKASISDSVTLTAEEDEEIWRKLTWLADWGFATLGGRQLNLVFPYIPQYHRELEWHREQARLKHKQDLKLVTKQRWGSRLKGGASLASLILSAIAVIYTIGQGEESRKEKTYARRLEERILQLEDRLLLVESQATYLLEGRSLPTTMPQKTPSDSSTYHKESIPKKQNDLVK